MKLRHWLFLTAALLALPLWSSTVSLIPSKIARLTDTAAPPVWVSQRSALTPNGDLRPELFTTSALAILKANRAQNSGPECRAFLGAPPLEDFSPHDSLSALTANSLTITRGDVVDTAVGFLDGTPGTLIAIQPTKELKAYGRVARTGVRYVFVPTATIATRSGLICSRSFSQTPTPTKGDEIVAFTSIDPIDSELRILPIDVDEQLVVQHGDRLYMPSALKRPRVQNSAFKSIDQIEEAVRTDSHIQDVPRRQR